LEFSNLMALPVSDSGRLQKLCLWLKASESKPFAKNVLGPLLTAFTPGFITFLGTKPETLAWAKSLNLAAFLTTPIGLASTAMVAAFVVSAFLKYIWDEVSYVADSQRKFSRDDVDFFLVAFSRVVQLKLKRFRNVYLQSKNSRGFGNARIFQEITKPEIQIDALMAGLHAVLSRLYANTSTRCALLKLDDHERPCQWLSSVGGSPRTQPEDLCNPNSTAMKCISCRTIVIVEDVDSELRKSESIRRFIAGRAGAGAGAVKGSQVCFPVLDVDTGKVLYVISIAANAPGSIPEAHKDLLQWALSHFSERIVLEHYLDKLRNKSNESKTSS
jgi:hypothetical protein